MEWCNHPFSGADTGPDENNQYDSVARNYNLTIFTLARLSTKQQCSENRGGQATKKTPTLF